MTRWSCFWSSRPEGSLTSTITVYRRFRRAGHPGNDPPSPSEWTERLVNRELALQAQGQDRLPGRSGRSPKRR